MAKQEELKKKYEEQKQKYDKLRADVAIKLKFLDENRVRFFTLLVIFPFIQHLGFGRCIVLL